MEARGTSERCVIEPRPLLENNIFHPPVKIFVGHPNRRVHLFSAIQLSLMSALSHSEQELTTDLNLSDNKMVELGQGGPRHWRVRPTSVPLWHSLILFAQSSSSSSVLSLVREGARSERAS